MTTYIERIASQVIDSDYPEVTQSLAAAGHHAALERLARTPHAARCFRNNGSRSILAAVLAYLRAVDLHLTVADALAVAHRVAERVAAVQTLNTGDPA
jgi:hypothetical protein